MCTFYTTDGCDVEHSARSPRPLTPITVDRNRAPHTKNHVKHHPPQRCAPTDDAWAVGPCPSADGYAGFGAPDGGPEWGRSGAVARPAASENWRADASHRAPNRRVYLVDWTLDRPRAMADSSCASDTREEKHPALPIQFSSPLKKTKDKGQKEEQLCV